MRPWTVPLGTHEARPDPIGELAMKTANATPAMPKATRKAITPAQGIEALAAKVAKAAPEAPKPIILSPAMKAAEGEMVRLALAADAGFRKAAEGIAECARMGIHTAYGVSLADYVVTVLSDAKVARSTVYFLKDVGVSYAALGATVADAIPMDGLRELASAAKGKPEAVQTLHGQVVATGKGGKVTTEDVRKVTRAEGEGEAMTMDKAAKALSGKALKYADGNHAAAIALIDAARKRLVNAETVALKMAAKAGKA